jgi:hypothetical protein
LKPFYPVSERRASESGERGVPEGTLRFDMSSPTQYILTMSFSTQDLQAFNAAGSNIIVAKPLVEEAGAVNVAWVVCRPFAENELSWVEEYGIYASNAEIANGNRLTPNAPTDASTPAQAGMLYTMAAMGAIIGPNTGGQPGSYAILNSYSNPPKGYLTFGMTQAAIVNSESRPMSALSAAAVLQNSKAVMTPASAVCLWVQATLASNTVVTVITSPVTKIPLSATNPSAKLKYDASSGTFLSTDGQHSIAVIPPKL